MRSTSVLLITTLITASSFASGVEGWRTATEDPAYLHRSVKKITDIIIEDIFSPPVVSRIYAYVSVAAYEAALPGNLAYRSLSGQISHLTPAPRPEAGKEYSFTLASVQAALVVGKAPQAARIGYPGWPPVGFCRINRLLITYE